MAWNLVFELSRGGCVDAQTAGWRRSIVRGGDPRGAPRPFSFGLLASALDQARDKQQDHRTNGGIDHLGDEPAADIESNAR
jgi:hypothetical protein